MKEKIEDMLAGLVAFRGGDRILFDNDFSFNSSLYKRSCADKPYICFGFNGKFKLTLIEVVLICVAAVTTLTIVMIMLKRRIMRMFRRKSTKE